MKTLQLAGCIAVLAVAVSATNIRCGVIQEDNDNSCPRIGSGFTVSDFGPALVSNTGTTVVRDEASGNIAFPYGLAGSDSFTMRYRIKAFIGEFANHELAAIPEPMTLSMMGLGLLGLGLLGRKLRK